MSKNLAERIGEHWRVLVIVAAVLAALLMYWDAGGVNLGLDLQGGSHLVLEVQAEDALNRERQIVADLIGTELDRQSIPYQDVFVSDDGIVKILAPDPDLEESVRKVLDDSLGSAWSVKWEKGEEKDVVNIRMVPTYRRSLEEGSVQKALEIIRVRVDEFGVAESVITRQGLSGRRIVVQLPGVGEPERIKKILQRTAYLEWRPITLPKKDDTPEGHSEYRPRATPEAVEALFGGEMPPDIEVLRGSAPRGTLSKEGEGGAVYYPVHKKPVVTGSQLTTANRSTDTYNRPAVSFNLSAEGAKRFLEYTANHIGYRVAVVEEDIVVTAPSIQDRIGASGIITGDFTPADAEDLALTLRSGALPASIEILEERSVGPSLGADSIRKGILAALVGFLAVMVFMLSWYRLAGVNAVLALVLNLVLVLGVMSAFGATLTLPGIAGLILTIGMAVDANVLIFERIKEEMRLGKTSRAAIEGGFGKAFSTVLDANITTLIAAIFLFNFGTGPIRGFAVTLSVGILCSLFTAIFVSRTLFDIIYARGRVERLSI